jgi:hypothetical protein
VVLFQAEQLLQLLETSAASATGAVALALLDCACALAFLLVGEQHHSSREQPAGVDAATQSSQADSRQPHADDIVALQHVSACISTLSERVEISRPEPCPAAGRLLAAPQIAALLAEWAPDIAAAEPHWRHLYSYAAGTAGLEGMGGAARPPASIPDTADSVTLAVGGVGDKVRAIFWSRRSLTVCTKACMCGRV